MEKELIVLDKTFQQNSRIDSTLSFKKFIDEIEKRAGREKTIKKHLSRFILNRASKHPEWRQPADVNRLESFETLLELIYSTLVSPFADEDTTHWGLGLPFVPSVFYGTSGIYRFIQKKADGTRLYKEDEKELHCRKQRMIYSFILHKLYNHPVVSRYDFFHPLEEETSVIKYMKINLNVQFIDVKVKGELPKLDLNQHIDLMEEETLNQLAEQLPLSLFKFEGFSIITATDASSEYVIEQIKGSVADQKPDERLHTIIGVMWLLKSLVTDREVEFGIFPLPELNGKLTVPYTSKNPVSILIRKALELKISEQDFLHAMEAYRQNPRVSVYNKNGEDAPLALLQQLLDHTRFQSLTLIPIFYHNKLIGILEALSDKAEGLGDEGLGHIGMTTPWLSQLVHKSLEEFNVHIGQLVQENFTSIQPSVEWKFTDAAWKHLKRFGPGDQKREIGSIAFEDVYPLYGAIDIRNSTLERNLALKKDLHSQVIYVAEILNKIENVTGDKIWSEKKLACDDWLTVLSSSVSSNHELDLNRFLSQEIYPLLDKQSKNDSSLKLLVDEYFASLHHNGHSIHHHRKELEESIKLINISLAAHLRVLREDMALKFPNYFETFRTDGVEYDVYVGQSIAPDKSFPETLIKDFRLMQLQSMAEIVGLTQSLISKMPVPLQTTQLIFVHENAIDISFRNDEKRFGVEGAYNIRYEILKKRIDKVHVKETGERLTQPGKIAIIYFSNEMAQEYSGYITTLQNENKLRAEVEFLDLEELQGVSGLKAIRVSAIY